MIFPFRKIFSSLIVLTFCWMPTHAQTGEAYSMPETYRFSMTSEINGKDYDLFVALPQNYETSKESKYPVLYVMDGNDGFPMAVSIHRMLKLYDQIPEIIIVGVGYPVDFYTETIPYRWNDLTPSKSVATDSMYAAQWGISLESGGASEFLQFLKDEAIPFVEDKYRTSSSRSIFGHSFGGLFATYVLQNASELFENYGISSPSLWWKNGEILNQNFHSANNKLNASVIVTAGALENEAIVSATNQFYEILKQNQSEQLLVEKVVFEDLNHLSVVPTALTRAFEFFYFEEEY